MTSPPSVEGVEFRTGRSADLRPAFELSRKALHGMAESLGVDNGAPPDTAGMARQWERRRQLVEFVSAQEGSFVLAEVDGALVGFARTCRFGQMEELTELHVLPEHGGRGIGPALLARVWPGDPTREMGRVAVAAGISRVLNAITAAGMMPAAGHWHMRAPTTAYLEARSRVTDAAEPPVVVLEADRARDEWQALEPGAIGHERPQLHDFFARTRTCLASVDAQGRPTALCWAGMDDAVGPAVGRTSQDLVPVVLQALDRVAKTQEPDTLSVYCATHSWWLLRRLRSLGFEIVWPIWVMSSVPLPGLDRYLPTRPAHVL